MENNAELTARLLEQRVLQNLNRIPALTSESKKVLRIGERETLASISIWKKVNSIAICLSRFEGLPHYMKVGPSQTLLQSRGIGRRRIKRGFPDVTALGVVSWSLVPMFAYSTR